MDAVRTADLRFLPQLRFAAAYRTPHVLVAAGLITLLQILLAGVVSGQHDALSAWRSLWQWDGGWYGDIALHGYHAPPAMTTDSYGNVAFFPAYPLASGAAAWAFGLDVRVALLLTAQVACIGFWTYFLLLLRRWNVPGPLAALAAALITTHPAAFYLVSSYSESLFLTAMLGYFYWSEKTGRLARVLTVAHGVVMTATRLVGLPLAVYPLVRACFVVEKCISSRARRMVPALLLAAIAVCGALGFFAFCQGKFGRWDLYFVANEIGWNVHPDYFALFCRKPYALSYGNPERLFFDPEYLSRMSVPAALWAFLLLGLAELYWTRGGRDTGWRDRIGLYVAAFLLFYISASGHGGRGMSSMIRFGLCFHVPLVLAAAHLFSRVPWTGRRSIWIALGVLQLLSLACQLAMAYRFTHGLWVA